MADITVNWFDPLWQTLQIGTPQLPATESFDDVPSTDIKRIALIPLFNRAALCADVDAEFSSLAQYASDYALYWGVRTDVLASQLLQRIIAADCGATWLLDE